MKGKSGGGTSTTPKAPAGGKGPSGGGFSKGSGGKSGAPAKPGPAGGINKSGKC